MMGTRPFAENGPFRPLPPGSWAPGPPHRSPMDVQDFKAPSEALPSLRHPTQCCRLSRCSHLARVGLPAPIDLAKAPSPDDAMHAEVIHGQLWGTQQVGSLQAAWAS